MAILHTVLRETDSRPAPGARGRNRQSRTLRRNLIAACLAILAVGGCGSSAEIGHLTQESVILAFGDSITSGKGANAEDAYPSVLARLTGYTVINAGHPGELSATGLERLPSLLEAHSPDLVILCHGGNDMLQSRPPADITDNLSAMINLIKQSGADVVLLGVPKPSIFLGTASFYEELARQHQIPCDLEVIGEILSTNSLKSDYVHPNAAGYRKLAESVATLINESQSA